VLADCRYEKGREGVLEETKKRLGWATQIVEEVDRLRRGHMEANFLVLLLERMLGSMIPDKTPSAKQALDFCLFKIKGRQSLTFDGYEHGAVIQIAKPAEYLMEAYLVH
jgi:hypothetical protein